jgi:asparagine synthase (glutamine-hydrolysing)
MGGIAQIYTLNNALKESNGLNGSNESKRQLSRGVPGVNRRYNKQKNRELSRMIENIRHRKPIKPISNENNSMQILFSGRIHNAPKIRKMLKPKHRFRSEQDGEVVLHLYEEIGEECVHRLEGAYAFAVYSTDEIHSNVSLGAAGGGAGLIDDSGEANQIFIARDPLGVKPLYISENEERVCIASEFKALSDITSDFKEFPIGSYYHASKHAGSDDRFVRFHSFSEPKGPEENAGNLNLPPRGEPIEALQVAKSGIQMLLKDAVYKRIEHDHPFGVYLSGGLDSSIIAALTAQEWDGVDSFAVGMEGSEDLLHARLCAKHLGMRHHEYVYSLEEMLEVLPTVIYHLESYDAALVRSSVPNYFLARMASEPNKVVLSGEGADELFCGYSYMKTLSEEERESEAYYLLETLHSTGLQRGDRMAAAFGMEARVPFLDLDFVQFALRIPDFMKYGPSGQEKWVLRQAFSHLLPREIVSRKKKKFSIGAGSSNLMAQVAEEKITDEEFAKHGMTTAGHRLKSKEELFYYKIFHDFFPQRAAEETVEFSRSL